MNVCRWSTVIWTYERAWPMWKGGGGWWNNPDHTPVVFKCINGQCHEIFCFRFFSWIILTHWKECNSHFEFFRKFTKIFASQGARPVSTTTVTNLPPVSTRPVETCHRYQWHRLQILPPVLLGRKYRREICPGVNNISGKFAADANDTVGI